MSDPTRLIDEAARRSIASDLDATLFVEAGAGSGKTTALVGRIVALVASGRAPITAIAAITFTEAAAAELRIKVREALEDRTRSSAGSLEERARWADGLGHIDEAPISTIHGFCNRVLAAHPIEAGLPPRFEVLDEISESIEWQHRWSAELDLLADDEAMGELLSLAWVLGIYDRHIEALASAVDAEWHRSRPDAPDLALVVAEIAERASAGVSDLRRSVRLATEQQQRCSDPTDKLYERLTELSEWETRLSAASNWRDAFALISAETRLFSRTIGGQKQSWDGGVETVRGLLEDARLARERLVQGVLDLVVGALAHYFEARAHVAAGDRRNRGVLNFHDLLVLTRDLLRDHPRVLESVRKRYTHLLIDEFQDTDRLQLDIARLIGVESGDWVPGRCFFVGDPKQSIYRFRGADLAAYESARSEIVGDGTTLLTSNFRSVPGIISFVNSCFEVLLGSRFQSLHAVRPVGGQALERSGSFPPVAVIGGEIPGKPLRREQRRIESEDCCRAIERAVAEESWLVEDALTGELRPARLGDVAILVPRRTGLVELEAALDQHDIGYRVESASLIFKSQEVRDVLHLARAIAEPGDQAALVGALRSPAYSIGDDELVRWAQAHGGWSIEGVPPPAAVAASPRIAAALGSIAGFRERLVELGPVGTLSFAVRERRLLQLAADSPHAREAWRRIRYLIERARVFVEAGGCGLAEFADWIDDQVQGGLRSSEAVVPDADEDVVRIMTVHGAKGLEFPITVLCGFGTTDETFAEYETALRHHGGATEVHFTKNLETSGYSDLKENERRLDAEEATRLLYVATTRARDHLIICTHHVKNGRQTLGERLTEIAAGLTGASRLLPSSLDDGGADVVPARLAVPLSGGQAERASPAPATPKIASIDTLEAYQQWRSARARRIEEATKQASVRATEVASLAGISHWGPLVPEEDWAIAPVEDEEAVLPARGSRRRGRAGTRVGRAVHATLQSLSLSDAVHLAETEPGTEAAGVIARVEAIAHAHARAERVGERGREVSRLVRAALTSPVVREAFVSGTARREVYVSAPSGGTVVDGYVDLCFTHRDGALTVIDYKTDSVRNQSEAAERAASYELQAATYALALSAVTGRPVARCVLVFLSPPAQPIEHELAGELLAERIATVGEVVGALA